MDGSVVTEVVLARCSAIHACSLFRHDAPYGANGVLLNAQWR